MFLFVTHSFLFPRDSYSVVGLLVTSMLFASVLFRLSVKIVSSFISGNVDECVSVPVLDRCDKNNDNDASYKHLQEFSNTQRYSLLVPHSPWPIFTKSIEDKKVDENGNALGHSADGKKNKKKKRETDKNVVVLCAKDVSCLLLFFFFLFLLCFGVLYLLI